MIGSFIIILYLNWLIGVSLLLSPDSMLSATFIQVFPAVLWNQIIEYYDSKQFILMTASLQQIIIPKSKQKQSFEGQTPTDLSNPRFNVSA